MAGEMILSGLLDPVDPVGVPDLILDHLVRIGFIVDYDELGRPVLRSPEGKENLRALHREARRLALLPRLGWIRWAWMRFSAFFARGEWIVPERIRPVLVEITERWHADLARLARLLWSSTPYSKGFGRRLGFLLLDEGNRGPLGNPLLIGILLLQSPPITLSPRDRFFQYPPGQKVDKINTTADVHSLMAVPPYNDLLGGKLVAYAAASNEVREAYRRKYAGRRTEIEGRVLPADLVALTAVSAFGRSSLYNRLRYRDGPIAISLGYAAGYGVFHLEPFYPFFRALLESRGISTRGGFDAGPRVKWQICVRALEALGLSRTLINHSVPREVFLFPLAHNLKDFMEGRAEEPLYRDLPFRDLAAYWHERWLLPRAERVDRWRSWEPEGLLAQVFPTDADGAFPSGQG